MAGHMTERESAVEHLRNAQQLCRALEDLFHEKRLDMLARDVHHIELRIVLALDEIQREVKELQARLGSTTEPVLEMVPWIDPKSGLRFWRAKLGDTVSWYYDDSGHPGKRVENAEVPLVVP